MNGTVLRTVGLLLVVALLSGCKTLNMMQDKKEESLQETLKNYRTAIRWGYPGQAYNYLHKDLAEKAVIPANLNNISITDYKVVQPPDLVSEKQASQTAVISYIFDDRQVEKSLTDRQLWEFNEETTSWTRINPIPEYQ
ncbi:hypothetical protein [Sedimenticola selenatireducens]|uniref:Uncharacterized protein n=1 Tax=Sedimenticola selenatireducens TaxID=191960 RepID=A0A557SH07_9GAMM|nr:hypothetical protein [Sedimenticola selenatireducens]TVO76671.1 hypothetical protein FHP88_04400 [Sedimenticola selenatireducens]TVT64114.1 MAG: hypothetical protein FHK78_07645 [Sedimenticola selenatireducens]